MWTTEQLPAEFRYDPAPEVRGSGLTIACRHQDPTCPLCIRAAARRIVAAQPTGVPS